MPVLQVLPIELLRQILSYLDPHALLSVALSSTFLNRVVEPFLYGSLGGYQGWLLPRLSAIIARPYLARLVRRIEFGRMASPYPTQDQCKVFSASAKQHGIEDIGWWDDAQALFLLQLVPDVRELCFHHTPLLCSFIEDTLSAPIESLPFTSLVKFKCDEYSQHSSVTLAMLLALMRLPSLRELTADMTGSQNSTEDQSVVDGIIAFAGQSAVTHLSLHYGNLSTSVLMKILQMPRALTHFSYTDHDEYVSVPDTTPLRTALRPVRLSLQSLSLGLIRALGPGRPIAETIGELYDWPALTRLKCSLPMLIGTVTNSTGRLVDVLPMSLRELELLRGPGQRYRIKLHDRWPAAEITDQLVELMQTRALEKLIINADVRVYLLGTGPYDEFEEGVKQRLVEAGRTRRCCVVCN